MKALRNYLDKIKPAFEKEGKLHAFRSVFDGFETFLFVPNTTAKKGVHIHDAIDSKRIMSMVVIALMPALLFGMYNVGYQNAIASGLDASFMDMFLFGALAVMPKILVSYVVGLGIASLYSDAFHTSTKLCVNLGGGFEANLAKDLALIIEAKYQIINNHNQFVPSVGVAYKF